MPNGPTYDDDDEGWRDAASQMVIGSPSLSTMDAPHKFRGLATDALTQPYLALKVSPPLVARHQ